ncbi:hypothetical protein Ancab_022095 [Ancistrocladus abbreviatus]
MVEKCDGLPLAINILGSLFHSKLERKHWEKVLSCSILDLPGGNDDILPALSLSYCFLPSCLKRCFAYCAMFPKGFEFEKEELVLLWMVGGFLDSPNNNIVIKGIGDECFMELLSRSFFGEATNLYGGCERLQKLPTAIGNLKQLRHLDVSNTNIEELPESICTLCNSQTLLLRWCDGVQKLLDDMWKLSSLLCLAMDRSNVDEMPVQLNMLEKLHSLDMFVVGKAGGSHLAELRGLQHLWRRLLIKGLENVANVDHARKANLNEMGDLDD